MNEKPLDYLARSSGEDIMIFLKWLHDNYHIKKLKTAQGYKRVYFMLYRRSVGRNLHAKIAQDVNDVSIAPFAL
jgi:hypothetical protein